MKKFYAWIKTLPPTYQTLFFAVETGVITACGLFAYHLFDVFSGSGWNGLTHLNWSNEIHDLEVGVIGAAFKAIADWRKGRVPLQEPAAPATT